MKHATGTLAFIARFVVIGLAAAFVISLLWPGVGNRLRSRLGITHMPAAAVTTNQAAMTPAPMGASGPVSYADAVAKAAPAVVNIYANKLVTARAMQMYSDPVLRRLFGGVPTGPSYQKREQSLGSGVIVNNQGYVLTNNHVIANADDIQVLLYDGRVAKAHVVGADDETDLAVLKIDAANLPVIQTADEKHVRTGDVVLAIGNPFGLTQTVTMGIVSAVGRQLSSTSPEDFVQTDAAINIGNSGGALINTNGELVGINTILIGRQANAEGIGFAIPVDTAKRVLEQLIETGHVIRGWLGADYGFVPVAADSGLPSAARGAQVTDVYPGSPAAQAGIQARDILLSIGSQDITDPADLRRREAALKPGSKVKISGLRNGAPFSAEVTLAQRPAMTPTAE